MILLWLAAGLLAPSGNAVPVAAVVPSGVYGAGQKSTREPWNPILDRLFNQGDLPKPFIAEIDQTEAIEDLAQAVVGKIKRPSPDYSYFQEIAAEAARRAKWEQDRQLERKKQKELAIERAHAISEANRIDAMKIEQWRKREEEALVLILLEAI